MTDLPPLLRLQNVCVEVTRSRTVVPLVRDATFDVREGEIVTLVGESGSGKSVTARTIMGLMQLDERISVSGSVELQGIDLLQQGPEEVRRLRGRDLTMVFQEPLSSLDPVFTVASQLGEGLRRREKLSRPAARERLLSALAEVGIQDGARVLRSFPHQLSGGMCQRVMIALALLAKPRLLIADEPTTALDVTIQAQILQLIDRLRTEEGMSVLLVTHDMGVAADIADRVVVMYAGRVVEDGDPSQIFSAARHPYTAGLLDCIPPMRGERLQQLAAIPGSVPDPSALPPGCAFQPRCQYATSVCDDDPPLERGSDGTVACHHPLTTMAGAR